MASDETEFLKYSKDIISSLQVLLWAQKKSKGVEEAKRRAVEYLRAYKPGDDVADKKGNTPLILAVSSGCADLVQSITNAISSRRAQETAQQLDEKLKALLGDCNHQRENALLRAAGACGDLQASGDCLLGRDSAKIFFHLLDLLLAPNYRGILNQKTKKRQNLLHLAFSTEYCQSCSDFCFAEKLLHVLQENRIAIDVRLEDFKYNTPLFCLIKNFAKSPLVTRQQSERVQSTDSRVQSNEAHLKIFKAFDNYCADSAGVDFPVLLKNSHGMDVAHICARHGCIAAQVFEALQSLAESRGAQVSLYSYKAERFITQTVLGGPAEGPNSPRSPHQQSFPYGGWTALHFACRSGHFDSVAYLLKRGFSLQDRTRDGKTCNDLAFERPENQEVIKKAFEQLGRESEGLGPEGLAWVLEYARNVDTVKCALDYCDGDCDNHKDALSEKEADQLLKTAWSQFKKIEKFKNCPLLEHLTVKAVMYMCFENDSATQYRALLHSSHLRKELKKNKDKTRNSTSSGSDLGELMSDKEIIDFFCEIGNSNAEEIEVPLKERWQVLNGLLPCILEPLVCHERVHGRPLFSYRDNGRIYLRKLAKGQPYFNRLSLIELAIVTGRPSMAKALLITRQFDLIPKSLVAIVRCNRMIGQEQLLNYYPIRDINAHLKGVKAFASKVALNAIDTLFRGSSDTEAELIFAYLLGKMVGFDGTGTSGRLPSSRLLMCRRPKSGRYDESGAGNRSDNCAPCGICRGQNKKEEKQRKLSTLELIKKSEKEDLYGAECVQELVQKIWRQMPKYSSAKKIDIFFEKSESLKASKEESEASEPSSSTCCLSGKASSGCSACFKRTLQYFICPKSILVMYAVTTLLFISLLIACLLLPSVSWNWLDVCVLAYLLSFFIQELHEWRIRATTPGEGHLSYFFDIWNLYDQFNIVFLLSAFIVKACSDRPWGDIYDDNAAKIGDESSIHRHFVYKVLMSVSLMLASAKFLKVLRYSRPIGVNVVIMPHIFVRDLLPFVIILIMIILSFGVSFTAILTVGRYSFENGNTSSTVKQRGAGSLFEIYTRSLLMAFGEFQLDSLVECSPKPGEDTIAGCYFPPGIAIFSRYVMPVFLLIVNLVMFNMLIAKFSNTVSRFERRSQLIWLAMRHELLLDYCRLSPWPPPLNLIGSLVVVCNYFRRHEFRKYLKKRITEGQLTKPCEQCQNSGEKARNCLLCRIIPIARSLGHDHEQLLIRQANQFRKRRHLIRTKRVETIEDDIEEELLGNSNLVNSEIAAIKFDTPAGGSGLEKLNAAQKKLSKVVRWARRSMRQRRGAVGPSEATGQDTAEDQQESNC